MKVMMMKLFFLLSLIFAPIGAEAKVIKKNIEYKSGNAVMEGYLAYDDSKKEKAPGILIVHEWTGLNDYVKARAEKIAQLGYVAFAVDIYGKGIRPTDPKDAGAEAAKYRNDDRKLFRERLLSGLLELKKNSHVDAKKIAAIGYCFGGTGVLELARSGADILGVVSFHGGLSAANAGDAKQIRAKVLVLHGADDPLVPAAEIADFENEMRKAQVDWQLIKYSNAVHSFTNPSAGTDNSKRAAYNKLADERSWQAMRTFFQEIFQNK